MSKAHELASGLPGPEILVVLALMGVLSAFFIPKMLHNAAKGKIAQYKEAIAMLEESYAQKRSQVALSEQMSLYDNIILDLNAVGSGDTFANAAGAPFYQVVDPEGNAHPCVSRSLYAGYGWVNLQNGLVMTGLGSQATLGDGTMRQKTRQTQQQIHLICMDANGAKGPNKEGVDVFWGNFQHQDEGAAFRWGRAQQWPDGSSSLTLWKEDGTTALGNPEGSDLVDLLGKR